MIVGVDPATSQLTGRQLDAAVVNCLRKLLDDSDLYLGNDGKFVVTYSIRGCGRCSESEGPNLAFVIEDGLVRPTDFSFRDMKLIQPCLYNTACHLGCGCGCDTDVGTGPAHLTPNGRHCKLLKQVTVFDQQESRTRMEIERQAIYPYWMSLSHFRRTGPPELTRLDVVTGATGCRR